MTLGVSQPLQIYIYTFLMQRFTFVLFAAMRERERHLSKYIFLKKRKKETKKQKNKSCCTETCLNPEIYIILYI